MSPGAERGTVKTGDVADARNDGPAEAGALGRTTLKRYQSWIADNARWERSALRPGDIVISTPAKCGTTWMQALCVMLVLNTETFDQPLSQISPWLDMQLHDIEAVVAALEAQQNGRVIKTHTPLDGLPSGGGVTYICVGRDPRDAGLSMQHHLANLNMEAVEAARAAAVGEDELPESGPPMEPVPDDPVERFWQWAYDSVDGPVPNNLAAILYHLQTFWDRRDDPGILLFHYSDLVVALPGEIRRLAQLLGIDVTDDRLESLAHAATFDRMKASANQLVPGAEFFRSSSEFFRQGGAGQWRDWLHDADLAWYEARVAELVPPDLAAWAHRGWRSAS